MLILNSDVHCVECVWHTFYNLEIYINKLYVTCISGDIFLFCSGCELFIFNNE